MTRISAFGKISRVDSLHLIPACGNQPQAAFEHQLCQLVAVDEDYFLIVETSCKIQGAFPEPRRGDKHTFPRILAVKSSDEFLYLFPRHITGPTLGLYVHEVKSKPVLPNDPINPLITCSSRDQSIALQRSAVSHPEH